MQAVFHHSTDDPDLHARVLRNATNLLDDDNVDIETLAVVTNSGGLQLVLTETPHTDHIQTLLERGVEFKQCQNTLDSTGRTSDDLIDGVDVVSSGVGELSRLQSVGFAYIRP